MQRIEDCLHPRLKHQKLFDFRGLPHKMHIRARHQNFGQAGDLNMAGIFALQPLEAADMRRVDQIGEAGLGDPVFFSRSSTPVIDLLQRCQRGGL
ncbi:hypothetical protein [Leisingera sp. F5]|uniref:hypothetical protein n=1 Tax=Leisingera sp. F5 TaxID=1813816 RepID=UPI0025BD72D1|nr:hypothetical protein [Leisingera sp. F5]